MKKISQLLAVGGLAVMIAVGGLAVRSAQAQDNFSLQAFQTTATPTPSTDTETSPTPGTNPSDGPSVAPEAQTPSMVALWDQVCVKKIPYTILAIPENATFEVVQPEDPLPPVQPGSSNPNELSCESVLTFGGKQVVVCTGPESFFFTLHVTDAGASEDFQVPLKACPIKRPPEPAPEDVNQ